MKYYFRLATHKQNATFELGQNIEMNRKIVIVMNPLGREAIRIVLLHISWYVPHSALGITQQTFLKNITEAPLDLSCFQRFVFLINLTAEIDWIFSFFIESGTDVPIHVKNGFQKTFG